MPSLFEPLSLGAVYAPHRVLMAPLTRQRATQPGDVPNELMLEHYVQRAGAGLIISEGTQVSPEGKGYAGTPGIHSDEQVAGWRRITDAVHAAGGRIAAQLWHTGRVDHASLHDGETPVSASALPYTNRTTVFAEDGTLVRVDCPTPRALETDELPRVVADYAHATRQARAAGFDAVEIHGAHGYLLHQFMAASSNQRTDGYGGSPAARLRFPLEVVDAVVDAWDAAHVGIRISPIGSFNGLTDDDGAETGLLLAAELAARDLAFLHLSEPDWAGGEALDDDYRGKLRAAFPGVIVGAGAYDLAKAERVLAGGYVDAVAFGRAYIANPDLPERLRHGWELEELRRGTVYGGGAEGYTDYPTYQGERDGEQDGSRG